MKLSGLGMTYRIREKGSKICIFEKVERIKRQLNKVLPEIDPNRLLEMLCHCRRYYEGNLYYGRRTSDPQEKKKRKKIELSRAEHLLYDFLQRNDLNPSTTYRWFLACRLPAQIKEKLERGEVSVKVAMRTAYNHKRVRESNLAVSMLDDMRMIVRSL